MNLQKQVEPLYQPRFRLPRAEACTPRDVAILLGYSIGSNEPPNHHAQSREPDNGLGRILSLAARDPCRSYGADGIVRHASYIGLRSDKSPTDVIREPSP